MITCVSNRFILVFHPRLQVIEFHTVVNKMYINVYQDSST